MTPPTQEDAPIRAVERVPTSGICVAVLAVVAVSGLLLDWLANNESVGVWMDRQWARINDTPITYVRQYLDTEDRLLLKQLPELDASGGGVYFFGASNLKWGTRLPELPPEQQRYIHNFGAAEGSPYYQRQFVEFLVNHKNLTDGDARKALVVYGTCFLNCVPATPSDRAVFQNMWQRGGLYQYDFTAGIAPAPLGPMPPQYYIEKARCTSFVQGCTDRLGRSLVPKSLRRRRTMRDREFFDEMYRARMGPDWRQNMKIHAQELEQLADYVQRQGMQFTVVLLPLASWHRTLPYPSKYRELIETVCKSRSIPLVDLSNLLDDSEFNDHIHANERGLDRLSPALVDLALAHLRRIGALPEP